LNVKISSKRNVSDSYGWKSSTQHP
jgi:hypothetical protein